MAILVFENNVGLANEIQQNLIAEGYDTVLIREPSEVPEDKDFWRQIDLIILDLMMGDADLPDEWKEKSHNGLLTGYVVYQNMCANKNVPVIVLTGLKDAKLLEEIRIGIPGCAILMKPVEYAEFLKAVRGSGPKRRDGKC